MGSKKQRNSVTRQHKLFYGSSYDRGVEHLLKMWIKIKTKFPDATLDICYGWELFLKGYSDNPASMAWKERIDKLMTQPGIKHHGRVSKDEVIRITKECGIWAYPTHFGETNCITALQCQQLGCVPVTMDYAGLKESVGSGVKIEGDIYDEGVQQIYLDNLTAMMRDEEKWKAEQVKGIEFSKMFSWEKIALQWEKYFK